MIAPMTYGDTTYLMTLICHARISFQFQGMSALQPAGRLRLSTGETWTPKRDGMLDSASHDKTKTRVKQEIHGGR